MNEQMVGVVHRKDGALKVVDFFDAEALPLELDADTAEDGALLLVDLSPDGRAAQVGAPLALPGTSRRLLYDLLAEHKINPIYSRAAREETAHLAANPGFDEPGLKDLTGLPFVTIDNADSRDLDQAMYLGEETGREGYLEVFYALADAAYYIRPGSALFEESLRRGASYYLPGMSVPMLPRALSEDLISLNPDKVRRALVFHAVLTPSGEVDTATFFRALIRSRRKLTYDGVQAFHDAGEAGPLSGQSFSPSLALMRVVGERLMGQAAARGVVRFHRRSSRITAGAAGFEVEADERNDVERWNEQLSLLCNMQGSRLLSASREAHVQPVFRVHEAPPLSQLETLSQRVSALIEVLALDPTVWGWSGPASESLAAWLERLPMSPPGLRSAIERQAMMMGTSSEFSAEKGPHYGLGAEEYGRFSSPMREVVGVFSHKELLEKLTGPDPAHDVESDEALRAAIISASNRAKSLQRRLTREVQRKVLDLWFSEDLARPEAERRLYQGTVLGMRSSRLYVELKEPALELKVYTASFEALDGGAPSVDREKVVLSRASGERIVLGDQVTLRVSSYDERRKRWWLVPC